MLFPAYFSVGAMVFALIVGVSVIGRIFTALSSLRKAISEVSPMSRFER